MMAGAMQPTPFNARLKSVVGVEPEAMDGYGGYDYGYDENVRPAENNVSASCCARLPIDPPASQA